MGNYKECRGCLVYNSEGEDQDCIMFDYDKMDECPCTTCLVKVTCVTSCEPRSGLANKIARWINYGHNKL